MICAALIPSFGNDPVRLSHQAFVIEHYRERWGIHAVIGTDTPDEHGRYSRACAINNAARLAVRNHPGCDTFVLCDNDMIPDPVALQDALQRVGSSAAVLPHDDIRDLSEAETERYKNTGELLGGTLRGWRNLSYVVVPLSSFVAVNGMDERFRGWGAEDNAFIDALEAQVGPVYRGNGKSTHLWHRTDPTIKDTLNLRANRARALCYSRADREQSHQLSREYGELGLCAG